MKNFETNNSELLEVLVNNGIDIICNENMEMMVSEEDADRIPAIVNELAPAAINDYVID